MCAQRGIGLGQPDSRLEHRDPRPRVDRQDAVEPAEVERHVRRLATQPADDARTTAERHHRDALLRALAQHRRDLRRVARSHDRVRSGRAVAGALGQQIQVGLAAGAQDARLAVVAHLGDLREPLAQPVRKRRVRKAHVLQRHRM
jgi:hypothetical protein